MKLPLNKFTLLAAAWFCSKYLRITFQKSPAMHLLPSPISTRLLISLHSLHKHG